MKETPLDFDFLILNRIATLYSAQRFQSEITRLKLRGLLISPEDLQKNESQFRTVPPILYRQGDHNFWSTQSYLSESNLSVINPTGPFLKARDKWATYKTWLSQNIPFPQSYLASELVMNEAPVPHIDAAILFDLYVSKLKSPFILKKRFSSQGRGVFLISSAQELKAILKEDVIAFQHTSVLEKLYYQNDLPLLQLENLYLSRWIVQECITESLGRDVRIFFLDDRNFTVERINSHSFRSNIHQGGAPYRTELTEIEHGLCARVHSLSGLKYSGVDFLRTQYGPLLLEINPSPGFEGIEKLYSANIALGLIELVSKTKL